MSDKQRITYDEPLLKGWRIRAESMDLESKVKIQTTIDEIYLLRDEAELFRSLSILSDGAIMELERNGQLPDRTEVRARVIHAKATEEHLKQAGAQVLEVRAQVDQLREALSEIYEACMLADADGELDSRIDGDLLDKARTALEEK